MCAVTTKAVSAAVQKLQGAAGQAEQDPRNEGPLGFRRQSMRLARDRIAAGGGELE